MKVVIKNLIMLLLYTAVASALLCWSLQIYLIYLAFTVVVIVAYAVLSDLVNGSGVSVLHKLESSMKADHSKFLQGVLLTMGGTLSPLVVFSVQRLFVQLL